MSLMPSLGVLKPHPAGGGIAYIGSSSAGSTTNATLTLPLPSGVVAGDTVLLLCVGDSSSVVFTPPTGSATAYNKGWGVDTQTSAAFAYQLVEADITAGHVQVVVTSSGDDNTVLLLAFSGVATSAIDVAAFTAGTTQVGSPVVCVADSITTTSPGDMLVYQGTPDVSNSGATWGVAPSGWTKGPTSTGPNDYTPQATAYLLQTSAGATGNQSMTATGADATPGAGLIALKAA